MDTKNLLNRFEYFLTEFPHRITDGFYTRFDAVDEAFNDIFGNVIGFF